MNIKILDSWLREYLKTKATPKQIGEYLSLTSCSVERLEPFGKNDFIYDIEVTTNRPDLMSVVGVAREAAAVLPQFDITAKFDEPRYKEPQKIKGQKTIEIVNDAKLVNRICAVVMEVNIKESPQWLKDRIESGDIRSLNNLVDITNYVMREIGHPTHVFDFDRLETKKLIIRKSEKGERIVTLDKKEHVLQGGDIVADNGKGEIVDLLGVMGTLNSVVTEKTKRILFFIDDNNPSRIRKTSMSLAIRTDAAILNEKGVDPESSMHALQRGIGLYQDLANGELISNIIDLYPNKPKKKTVLVTQEKIEKLVGVPISLEKAGKILGSLGFSVKTNKNELLVQVPSWRLDDIETPEDLIEEIARIFGYHNIPNILPPASHVKAYDLEKDQFYWEQRAKEALKYWGFTETHTYAFVSEDLFQGPIEDAVTLSNPLNEELLYMRNALVPSLLQVLSENKTREEVKIFEIANVYIKKRGDLPEEIQKLAAVTKSQDVTFFHVKGYIQQLSADFEIHNLKFKKLREAGIGADVYIGNSHLGEIEQLEKNVFSFEINFDILVKYARLKKIYTPIPKYPPILEDIALIIDAKHTTGAIIEFIKEQHSLVKNVSLLDQYKDTRTFHIVYQHPEKNLTNEEVSIIREKILSALAKKFNAKLKE